MTEENSSYKLKPVEECDSCTVKPDEPPVAPTNAQPKYSVVLRFWSTPQELEVVDIVSCQNKFTKANFVKFIDTDGRMWDNVPQNDVILITNSPGKEDIEDFMRLKRETVELNKLIANKKPDMDDVSIR